MLRHTRIASLVLLSMLAANGFCAKPEVLKSLDGQTIQFNVGRKKADAAPTTTYELHFTKSEYQYNDPRTKKNIIGNYKYRVLNRDKGIALITFEEIYKNQMSNYTTLLYAKDDKKGLYIYKKYNELVSPDSKMNNGWYVIS